MKPIPTLLMLSAALLSVCGCTTPQRFQDVSSSPDYRAYVGDKYLLKVPMHISGVKAPPGYQKTVDYYVVNPASAGWSGPELITRDTLAAGTEVTVTAVRRCINCPFEEVVDAEIRVLGYMTEFARPIHLDVKYLASNFATKREAPSPESSVRAQPGTGHLLNKPVDR